MQASEVAKKLKKYLDDNGIRYAYCAEKLCISPNTLYAFLRGERPLPKKAWKKVIVLTKGKISMKELLENFLSDVQDPDDQKNSEIET